MIYPKHKFWDRDLWKGITPRWIMATIAFIALMIFAGWAQQY